MAYKQPVQGKGRALDAAVPKQKPPPWEAPPLNEDKAPVTKAQVQEFAAKPIDEQPLVKLAHPKRDAAPVASHAVVVSFPRHFVLRLANREVVLAPGIYPIDREVAEHPYVKNMPGAKIFDPHSALLDEALERLPEAIERGEVNDAEEAIVVLRAAFAEALDARCEARIRAMFEEDSDAVNSEG